MRMTSTLKRTQLSLILPQVAEMAYNEAVKRNTDTNFNAPNWDDIVPLHAFIVDEAIRCILTDGQSFSDYCIDFVYKKISDGWTASDELINLENTTSSLLNPMPNLNGTEVKAEIKFLITVWPRPYLEFMYNFYTSINNYAKNFL